MTSSTGFNREPHSTRARVERRADFYVEDWMLQLMLVVAVTGAIIASALNF